MEQSELVDPHRGGQLFVVLINQIRPLIKIQKEENWHNLRTNVIYIDMFPHVLEECCFVGHTLVYGG